MNLLDIRKYSKNGDKIRKKSWGNPDYHLIKMGNFFVDSYGFNESLFSYNVCEDNWEIIGNIGFIEKIKLLLKIISLYTRS